MIKHNGKAVTDIKVIQNKAQVDVNKAVWNGVTVWQRVKDLAGHTTVTISPTGYQANDQYYFYSYSGKRPTVTSVVYKEGSSSTTLTTDDYSVSYTGDSGSISHYDEASGQNLEGTKSASAKVTIKGQGSYTGSVDKTYSITHTYKLLRYTLNVLVSDGSSTNWKWGDPSKLVKAAYMQVDGENYQQLHVPTQQQIESELYFSLQMISDIYVSLFTGTWAVTPADGYVVRGWSDDLGEHPAPTKGIGQNTLTVDDPRFICVYIEPNDC